MKRNLMITKEIIQQTLYGLILEEAQAGGNCQVYMQVLLSALSPNMDFLVMEEPAHYAIKTGWGRDHWTMWKVPRPFNNNIFKASLSNLEAFCMKLNEQF